jgi:photosystem II stability/assembly factor-like uncharacterized protein
MAGRILPDEIYNILITKDGGKSWQRHPAPVIISLVFFDSLVGFAGGDSIYKTTDGGISWQAQTIEPSQGIGIFDIFFLDGKYGWAIGGGRIDGSLLSSVDSGKSWQFNDSLAAEGFSVYFTDTLHGYVAMRGDWYMGIAVTSDGGKTWGGQILNATPNDMVFTDDKTGWVVGDYGFIWHTTDQGVTWNQVESGTTSHLYRVFFFENGAIGYIMGENGTLLRYESPVAVKEETAVPMKSFKVFQNYPNPFNSTTQIRFELPGDAWIRLTIYDILGKEVITLLNEEKKQGTHSVAWNGRSNHGGETGSGVYFYRFNAGTFHQVQSLILLK